MSSTFKDGAWHGIIEAGGQFPPEKGRYHLYIGISYRQEIELSLTTKSQDYFVHSHIELILFGI